MLKVYEAAVPVRAGSHRIARVALGRLPPGYAGYRAQGAAARDLLTWVAAQTLREVGEALEVTTASNGRPLLCRGDSPLENVFVSLAHSRRWLAVGLARDGRIGVDVEQEKPGRRIAAMADWLGWPECDQPEAFYRAWTYREACIKCRGGAAPSPAADPFPPEATDWPARHHAFYGLVASGVHGCAVLEMPAAVHVAWRTIDSTRLPAWS